MKHLLRDAKILANLITKFTTSRCQGTYVLSMRLISTSIIMPSGLTQRDVIYMFSNLIKDGIVLGPFCLSLIKEEHAKIWNVYYLYLYATKTKIKEQINFIFKKSTVKTFL